MGQLRVVEITRALCADPVLLLFDEPAAGLRYAGKAALADLLRKLRDQGMIIPLVEHRHAGGFSRARAPRQATSSGPPLDRHLAQSAHRAPGQPPVSLCRTEPLTQLFAQPPDLPCHCKALQVRVRRRR